MFSAPSLHLVICNQFNTPQSVCKNHGDKGNLSITPRRKQGSLLAPSPLSSLTPTHALSLYAVCRKSLFPFSVSPSETHGHHRLPLWWTYTIKIHFCSADRCPPRACRIMEHHRMLRNWRSLPYGAQSVCALESLLSPSASCRQCPRATETVSYV